MIPSGRLLRIQEECGALQVEIRELESQLNGYDFREKFEKAKNCLRILYRDHTYSSRADWVNEVLDDPEVQAWIKECD